MNEEGLEDAIDEGETLPDENKNNDTIEIEEEEDVGVEKPTDPEPQPIPVVNRPSNATVTSEYTSERLSDKHDIPDEDRASIPLPSMTKEKFLAALTNIRSGLSVDDLIEAAVKGGASEEDVKEWFSVLRRSDTLYTQDGMYDNIFHDEDRAFVQDLEVEDRHLGPGPVKLKEKTGSVRGQQAILLLGKKLNLGDYVRIPLWHSGFWVYIRPPSEEELIDLFSRMMKMKVELGRSSGGFFFSNYSVYYQQMVTEFAKECIVMTSVADMPLDNIEDHLVLHDIPLLASGLAAGMFPSGFDYDRACMDTIKTTDSEGREVETPCQYVLKGLINLHKLFWVDKSALTVDQKSHMARFQNNSRTLEDVKVYKEAFTTKNRFTYKTKSGVNLTFVFQNPSAKEYFESGTAWVDRIVQAVEVTALDETFKNKKDEEKRKMQILNDRIAVTLLNRYGHMVKEIIFDEAFIQDRETIGEALDRLCSEEGVHEEFTRFVHEYIEKSTISLIGIPSFTCPKCKTKQTEHPEDSRMVDVIPINPFDCFFGLIIQKVLPIQSR